MKQAAGEGASIPVLRLMSIYRANIPVHVDLKQGSAHLPADRSNAAP